jgi:hypothetical protein
MSSVAAPTLPAGLLDVLRVQLQGATVPLTVADVAKGLTRPSKMKAADFQEQVKRLLDEEVRLGRAFSCPSGTKGALRYWSRDEKHFLRDRVLELASTPQAIATFTKQLKQTLKGVDGSFVESVVREMIGEEMLFEHPSKKKGTPLFGAEPAPPPAPAIELPPHRKKLDKLIADCQKLLSASGATPTELFRILQSRLLVTGTDTVVVDSPEVETARRERLTSHTPAEEHRKKTTPEGGLSLDELILKAVATAPVLSIAELRREMPSEFQGAAFDQAVLRLAEERKVYVTQDAHPASYSAQELAEFVRAGDSYLTTISKGE